MQCVNHPGIEAKSFCQNCGKALCADCVRTTANGQILCEQCLAAGTAGSSQGYWQPPGGYSTPNYPGFSGPGFTTRGAPNPGAAAVLGLIPGVGAMYNGQLFKGLIHVVIFVVLISLSDHYGIFGLFVAGWVVYQSFEAFHTAKARRDGQPLPDPFGLNELGNSINWGAMGFTPRSQQQPGPHSPGHSGSGPYGAGPYGTGQYPSGQYAPGQNPVPYPAAATAAEQATQTQAEQAPFAADAGTPYEPVAGAGPSPAYGAPYTGAWSGSGYQTPPYTENFEGYAPGTYPPGKYPPGAYPPGTIPPIPPIPPYGWRRREPIWAIVLIFLGVVFLLKTMGVITHLFFHVAWPLLLIGLGIWLVFRRLGYTMGGPK